MPRGRPHASCFRQVESYLKDAGMAGLTSAWVMETEAEGVPSQGGRGDALLRRMPPSIPDLTCQATYALSIWKVVCRRTKFGSKKGLFFTKNIQMIISVM